MVLQFEQVAAPGLVGGSQTALHSHAGGGGGPAIVTITANVANSLATLTSVTGLGFSVVSNRSYAFSYYIRCKGVTSLAGIGLTMTGPANNGVVFDTYIPVTSILAKTFSYSAVSAFANATALVGASVPVLALMDGVILPTISGVIAPRFAAATASLVVTIMAGSFGVMFTT